ncbi:hypothetical protein [Rhizobium mongolense]|uniref:Uncharacterized protein n=1 Tax=Rhizobium mongolense TaxID=57676 RepID=A0ABR6IX73_9HYPH|nr:hypothetical protein [Rhizobium mongolense]MBB4232524.1 hypothetical protein [Rhizobium mongolense]
MTKRGILNQPKSRPIFVTKKTDIALDSTVIATQKLGALSQKANGS